MRKRRKEKVRRVRSSKGNKPGRAKPLPSLSRYWERIDQETDISKLNMVKRELYQMFDRLGTKNKRRAMSGNVINLVNKIDLKISSSLKAAPSSTDSKPWFLRSHAAALVLERIPKWRTATLLQFREGCIGLDYGNLSKQSQHRNESILNAIHSEFLRRGPDPESIDLDDDYFKWPRKYVQDWTDKLSDHHPELLDELFARSFMKEYGYSVGASSKISPSERLKILDSIFAGTEQLHLPDWYVAEWGRPESSRRLQKMAYLIAHNIWRAKGRHGSRDFSTAISDWESDLDYLYEKYYVGKFRFDFSWPHV